MLQLIKIWILSHVAIAWSKFGNPLLKYILDKRSEQSIDNLTQKETKKEKWQSRSNKLILKKEGLPLLLTKKIVALTDACWKQTQQCFIIYLQ